MAKRTRPIVPPSDPPTELAKPPGGGQKPRKRLERDLADLVAAEAQRMAQLQKIRARAANLRAKLAVLEAPAAAAPQTADPDSPPAGPTGYCMHERRRVTIHDFTARTLANGRTAIIGTCSSCGGRVAALAARPEPTDDAGTESGSS